MKMYCLSLNNSHLNTIKKMNYIPVGLGTDKFDMEWTRDNSGTNISHKNKFLVRILFIIGYGKII